MKSPLINMFLEHDDYLKMVTNLKYYMDCRLELVEMKYAEKHKRVYPIVKCGDILLKCLHYDTFEEVENCWYRRRERINWENLLVMFFDDSDIPINEFREICPNNSVIFAYNGSVKEQGKIIDLKYLVENKEEFSWELLNKMPEGYYYDSFELLLNKRFYHLYE